MEGTRTPNVIPNRHLWSTGSIQGMGVYLAQMYCRDLGERAHAEQML